MLNAKGLKGLTALTVLIACLLACKSLGEPHTLKSRDGKLQITVPANMSEAPSLNSDAEITAANRISELYAFVLTKKKGDYATPQTLDEHADIMRKALMDQLTGADSTPAEKLNIDGKDARRLRVTGTKDGIKLAYFMTIVEASENFHHIWTWTEGSKANENEPILNGIADSFRINP